jgi:hypothetical protein
MTFVLAVTSVIALSALALSVLATLQTRALLRVSARRTRETHTQQDARLEALHSSLEHLTADVREIEQQPGGSPGSVKTGLNLSKRSQALRMHRRGETPAQIATALDIPPQEVELLIKVHRIVLSNI